MEIVSEIKTMDGVKVKIYVSMIEEQIIEIMWIIIVENDISLSIKKIMILTPS